MNKNMFSLRTLIDDILLIVRNNNISESEDLSRAQIAAWILHYRSLLHKEDKERKEAEDGEEESFDDSTSKTVGPLKLVYVQSLDNTPLFTRRTESTLEDLFEEDPDSIVSVFDQEGHVIQPMNRLRRHFHYYRKYTARDLTYFYDGGYIYIQGISDNFMLENIWVKYLVSVDSDSDDEDSTTIPGWMIPEIKKRIFNNELAFMIRMPSDDDNNSTLDGIKPHGPQDQEK